MLSRLRPTTRKEKTGLAHRLFSSNVASIRLYRILIRQVRALPAESQFMLQPPLNPRDYGRARLITSSLTNSSSSDIFKMFTKWNQEKSDDEDDEERILSWYRDLVGQDLEESEYHDDDLDSCLWTTREVLHEAIRAAFRSSASSSADTITRQRYAIAAIQSLQDVELMLERSSTFTENGLRVVATSSCIGFASSGSALIQQTKHRFAYRIRVENLLENDKTVQLLGRTWKIQEHDENGLVQGDAVVVNAPNTGAVGHLPVLQPGNVFEYMSGCELATETGTMGGLFHMAIVPAKTPSAMVGDPIDAFAPDANKFELVVQPFPLIADTNNNNRAK